MITTVLGDIENNVLGFCQCHEHLFIARGQHFGLTPDVCIDDIDKSAAELAYYHTCGGNAIVDAQPLGCGRDAHALAEISRASAVHIIASTGFHKLIFYPQDHWIFELSEAKLADIYISELREGMYTVCDSNIPQRRTKLKAGQIKTALDTSFTDDYRKLFSAAATAAGETGSVLMVHIEAGSDPLMIANFLLERGLRPEQLIFCHMDRAIPDLALHKIICDKGITLEYDTIARPKYHDDEHEISIVQHMLAAGYEDQLLMSLDTTRARLKSYGGSVGLNYIVNEYLPKLRLAGVSQEVIDKVFVANPSRIYAQR